MRECGFLLQVSLLPEGGGAGMGLLQGGEVSDEWIDVSGGVVVSARTTFVVGLGSWSSRYLGKDA